MTHCQNKGCIKPGKHVVEHKLKQDEHYCWEHAKRTYKNNPDATAIRMASGTNTGGDTQVVDVTDGSGIGGGPQ